MFIANVHEEPFLNLKEEVIKNTAHGTWHRIFNTKYMYEISKLIIDCKNFKDILMEDERTLQRIELLSVDLCYKLYVRRLKLLENEELSV